MTYTSSVITLTREVRFTPPLLPPYPGIQPLDKPANSWSSHPPLEGMAQYLTARLTVAGVPHPATGYLLNIKDMDQVVRAHVLPLFAEADGSPVRLISLAWPVLQAALNQLYTSGASQVPVALQSFQLLLSPYLSYEIFLPSSTTHPTEPPMIRLNQTYEFSAAHRLHVPSLSDAENLSLFSKCNNPAGHGHNYQLQVTLAAPPSQSPSLEATGVFLPVGQLDALVNLVIIDHLDHKHLNTQVPEFADVNPSVENIASMIFKRLKPHLPPLSAITVWETPKTWAQYSE